MLGSPGVPQNNLEVNYFVALINSNVTITNYIPLYKENYILSHEQQHYDETAVVSGFFFFPVNPWIVKLALS